MILQYVPGVVGAIAGFVNLQFTGWLNNWSLEFVVFIVVYLLVTISLDKAMARYGRKSKD
jgi:membrane protein implicated in regulation of membrane protease activity